MIDTGRQLLLTFTTAALLVSPLSYARDVPYVPTPQPVVSEMLRLAKVGPKDLLYDLGSGDGRIVITAAKEHGTRGVGVDIDPERISESRENAQRAGVTDKVKFVEGDLFKMDLRSATAVTLYLLPAINLKLRPKLLEELRPGTPIVSHDFDMGDWAPEQKVTVGRSTVYLWHVPARVAGTWKYRVADKNGGEEQHELRLEQEIQTVRGTVKINGEIFPIENGEVKDDRLAFTIHRSLNGAITTQRFEGRVVQNKLDYIAAVTPDLPDRLAMLARD